MEPQKLLTRDELASLWQVSKQTLDRLRSAGKLPWVDISPGRGARAIVRFRAMDVAAYSELDSGCQRSDAA
jgi:hypothetical protein